MKDKNFKDQWDREQFKKVLNERLPLNKEGSIEDKRRSEEWTERKIRTYFSGKSALPEPIREGKKVFYTEEHLTALEELLNLQDMGLSYKSSSSLYSTFSRNTDISLPEKDEILKDSENSMNTKDDILALLNGMKVDKNLESSMSPKNLFPASINGMSRGLSKARTDVSVESFNKYKLGVDIEISIKNNMNIEDAKKDIQEWLNNLK